MSAQTSTRHDEAKELAAACARVLKEQFGAREVYVFGSLAGQSPWHSRSDIDLAVEGLAPEDYVTALSALWRLLPDGLELDLVTIEDASPELRAKIQGGALMVDHAREDAKTALTKEVSDELVSLTRIADEAKQLLTSVSAAPTSLETRAAGSIIHDFYSSAERIFERIAVRLGPGLPAGDGWHTLLLRGMETEVAGIRPALIDHALALRLSDYLRFRHLFRHSYGFELQWEKLRPLLEDMGPTLALLRQRTAELLQGVA